MPAGRPATPPGRPAPRSPRRRRTLRHHRDSECYPGVTGPAPTLQPSSAQPATVARSIRYDPARARFRRPLRRVRVRLRCPGRPVGPGEGHRRVSRCGAPSRQPLPISAGRCSPPPQPTPPGLEPTAVTGPGTSAVTGASVLPVPVRAPARRPTAGRVRLGHPPRKPPGQRHGTARPPIPDPSWPAFGVSGRLRPSAAATSLRAVSHAWPAWSASPAGVVPSLTVGPWPSPSAGMAQLLNRHGDRNSPHGGPPRSAGPGEHVRPWCMRALPVSPATPDDGELLPLGPESGVRSPEPGARSPKPEARSPKPGARRPANGRVAPSRPLPRRPALGRGGQPGGATQQPGWRRACSSGSSAAAGRPRREGRADRQHRRPVSPRCSRTGAWPGSGPSRTSP
ncbi:hypothetical protein SUDANB37_03152 [Streptomyces sp. enrichment culture]